MSEKLAKTDAQWREQLSDLAYKVTRKARTEPAFSHDNFPKDPGRFMCTCCGEALFSAETKFDSGTGWPSFYGPIEAEAIEEHVDKGWFTTRTEVRCTNCDAHLGHVFPDGPQPTGLRYCMNGVALDFEEQNAEGSTENS